MVDRGVGHQEPHTKPETLVLLASSQVFSTPHCFTRTVADTGRAFLGPHKSIQLIASTSNVLFFSYCCLFRHLFKVVVVYNNKVVRWVCSLMNCTTYSPTSNKHFAYFKNSASQHHIELTKEAYCTT